MGPSYYAGGKEPSIIDLCVSDVRPSEFAYFVCLVHRWACPYIASSASDALFEAVKKGDAALADKILCSWGVRGEDGSPPLSPDVIWDGSLSPPKNAPRWDNQGAVMAEVLPGVPFDR